MLATGSTCWSNSCATRSLSALRVESKPGECLVVVARALGPSQPSHARTLTAARVTPAGGRTAAAHLARAPLTSRGLTAAQGGQSSPALHQSQPGGDPLSAAAQGSASWGCSEAGRVLELEEGLKGREADSVQSHTRTLVAAALSVVPGRYLQREAAARATHVDNKQRRADMPGAALPASRSHLSRRSATRVPSGCCRHTISLLSSAVASATGERRPWAARWPNRAFWACTHAHTHVACLVGWSCVCAGQPARGRTSHAHTLSTHL